MRIEVTEQQLRRYCELLGTDPDEMVPDPENASMTFVLTPRWRAEAQNLLRAKAACLVFEVASRALGAE